MMIEVRKAILRDGQELFDYVNEVRRAVTAHGMKKNKSFWLVGIYTDSIIMKDYESGRYYKSTVSRDKEGYLALTDPLEVRMAFLPVGGKTEKADRVSREEVDALLELIDISKEEAPTYVDAGKDEEKEKEKEKEIAKSEWHNIFH